MKRSSWILVLFALAAILNTSGMCLEIKGFIPDKVVTYKTIDEVELKLHVFEPPDHKVTDRRAAIVFFFGGGWKGGSPTQFHPHCEHLASRGMIAVSAQYRVSKVHGTSPRECVKDGKSALRWMRAHADELGVDPARIAAGGGSAGGHVAAALGNVDGFEEQDEDKEVAAKPNALVLFNPVFDNGPDGYGYARVKEYWREFSPLHNIDEDSPPTIVFLGTKDKLIPVATAEKYRDAMAKNGVRCDLHLYEGRTHGFFNHRGDKKDYRLTMAEVDKFLASLGFLED